MLTDHELLREKAAMPIKAGAPRVRFLSYGAVFLYTGAAVLDSFSSVVIQEYNGKVRRDFRDNPALNIFGEENRDKYGSNPYAVALINEIICEAGLRVIFPNEIQKAVNSHAAKNSYMLNFLVPRRCYADLGLLVRSKDDPNKYLASSLIKQIRERYPKLRMPAMIPLAYLRVIRDENAPDGLSFKLTEDARVYSTNPKINIINWADNPDTGLPSKFTEDGRMLSLSGGSGVTRVIFTDGWRWLTDGDNLASSYDSGRIVVKF